MACGASQCPAPPLEHDHLRPRGGPSVHLRHGGHHRTQHPRPADPVDMRAVGRVLAPARLLPSLPILCTGDNPPGWELRVRVSRHHVGYPHPPPASWSAHDSCRPAWRLNSALRRCKPGLERKTGLRPGYIGSWSRRLGSRESSLSTRCLQGCFSCHPAHAAQ